MAVVETSTVQTPSPKRTVETTPPSTAVQPSAPVSTTGQESEPT
jgi:hypothetical protein